MKFSLMVGAPDMVGQGGYVRTPVGSFADTLAKAARLGFDGVEVLYGRRLDGDIRRLRAASTDAGVRVAGFNSGRLFFDHGLTLLCGSSRECAQTRDAIYELVRMAGAFSAPINIGMFRGLPVTPDRAPSIVHLITNLRQIADYAAPLGVELLIEPANKDEFPFISSTREGIDLVRRVERPNVNLMLDTFHMAVEGEHMGYSIEQAFPFLKHIHFLDLDRDPPSQGSRGIDLHLIFSTLKRLGYRHYLSMPLTKAGDEFATRDLLSSLRSLADSA